MLLLKIYLSGLAVLITAIGLNLVAGELGLSTWYTFLALTGKQGLLEALKSLNMGDYLFLFLIYPVLLGLAAYLIFYLTRQF
jgi:hypothetical protein